MSRMRSICLAAEELTRLSRRADLPLPAAPRNRLSRRHEITASDVAFSLTTLKSKGHPAYLVRAARSRRGRRRRQADGPVRASSRRAASTCRRSRRRCRSFPKILCDAAVRRDLAGSAAGLRALSRCAFRAGPLRRIRAGEELVGREASGFAAASTISTRCGTSIIATAKSASRPLPAATICSAKSSPRASGRRATISPRFATDASSATSFPTSVRPARRAGCSIPGGTNSGIGAFARR